MAQNTNTSLSLANLIDILNKAQSIDRRYGVYDNETDALTAMAQYGLDGRLVAVYTDKSNGVCKLYKYNEVHHRLDSVTESDNTKLDKIWADIEEQTTTNLNDTLVVNSGGALRKTTVAKILANVADTNIFITVTTLPAVGEPNKIYIIPSDEPTSENEFDEWVWIDEKWERIGGLSIDLSNYYTKTQANNLLNNKVDKDGDKQLSDENYTLTEKNKLASITAIFTTALKNAYDNVVTWISTNGQNILDHINSPHAPADAEKNRPFGQSEDTVMAGDDDRIVDGGVVRESVLLTSKDDIDDVIIPGHYHIFEGDIPVGFLRDSGGAMKVLLTGENNEVFQIIHGADNTLFTRSFLEGSWTEWNWYAPMDWVNNNFAKLSDIYKENAVLDGDWFLKPNTEDTYNTVAREYIINKVLYTDTITGEVTRAPRHATLRRWDMITVEADHTFLITSGVPALDPTRPIPSKQQAVLTYIFVSAIADAPPTPTFLLLYDENVGEPAEANVTTSEPSKVTLDSTVAPFQGTTHILFKDRVSDTVNEAVVFTFSTLQNLSNYGKLILHMASGYGGADNNQFLIHIKNEDDTIASFSSVSISWSPTGVGDWERGVLDMSEYANIPNDEFDKIVIDASNGPGWDGYIQEDSKLDYIFLTEKDDTTPVNPVVIQRTSEIPINDGATGVSRYAEMVDLENATVKPDIILTANSVLNINWNGRDVITEGYSLTVNPNTQDYEDSFEVYLYNNSANDSAIVLNAKAGVTYTVIDNDVSSATVFLQAYGTAVFKRIGNTQNYILRGYII